MKKLFENWNRWMLSEGMSDLVDGNRIHLYHYSRAEGDAILLDPKRFESGRNSWSMREYKVSTSIDIHKSLKALAGKDKPHPDFPELFSPIREEGAKIYKGVYYNIRDGSIPVVAWFEEIEATRNAQSKESEEI